MTYKSDELNKTKDAQSNINSDNNVNEFIDSLIADCFGAQGCTAPDPDPETPAEKPKKDNWSYIIDNLVETRRAKCMTQSDLAHESGLAQSVIARFESKKHAPQLDTIVKVAAALDCEITVTPDDM